jgi:uncharacterized protein (DUF983 family)
MAAVQTPGYAVALTAAWARDEQALLLSQRCLALLHARWRAGSLLSLTPEEAAFFAGLQMRCPGASRGRLDDVFSSTLDTLRNVLTFSLLGPPRGLLLQKLRSVCGLTPADENVLRELQQHNEALRQGKVSAADELASIQARSAADVARHGLRCCALPACGDTEAHPKLYNEALRSLPRRRLLLCAAQQGGLEAPQARGQTGAADLTRPEFGNISITLVDLVCIMLSVTSLLTFETC